MFVSFVVAMVATMALIPLLTKMSSRLGMLDHPGPRKVHAQVMPRVGGIAMLVGLLIPLLALQVLPRQIIGILAGVLIVVVEGVWDDRKTLGHREKFLAQFAAAITVVAVGDVQIREVVLFSEIALPLWLSFPLSVLVIVALTNAINLADGLDGLAGGISFLCCAALGVLAYSSGNTPALLLAMALCGAILGFLRFNTFPARVFMGDGGSQLLGLTIASLAIVVTQSELAVISATTPLFLLAIPILDTVFVMVQRMREGRSPFSADRNHLHHRLLALGLTHGQAVASLYATQAGLFLAAYLLRYETDLVNIMAFSVFGLALLLTLVRPRERAGGDRSAEAAGEVSARVRKVGGIFADAATREVLRCVASQILNLSLVSYCVLGIVTLDVPRDIGYLLASLVIAMSLTPLLRLGSRAPLVARSIAYVLAAVLSYLFLISPGLSQTVVRLETTLVLMIALSTAAALRFAETESFKLNTMDLLVLFTAVVIPNLPGTAWDDANLPSLAARLAVLFYALEVVFNANRETLLVGSVTAALTICVLAVKCFF